MYRFNSKAKGYWAFSLFLIGVLMPFYLRAQEHAVALPGADCVPSDFQYTAQKATVLGLPFFEDFADNGMRLNSAKWRDKQVYISNTMSGNQFSRGMAVFDANNRLEVPYDSLHPFHLVLADSLTTQSIDLSGYSPSDSLWLSFYYEPAGNGFLPKAEDSLILYFLNSAGGWVPVWKTGGETEIRFRRVMISVADTAWFHGQFAFRFVNKATHGISNSNWNLDYIYLAENRNYLDTLITDLAFTQNSSNLLADFTAMPFRHFKTNTDLFLADSLKAYLRNNGAQSVLVQYGFKAKEINTGTVFNGLSGSGSISSNAGRTLTFPSFSLNNFNPPSSANGIVKIETKYYATSIYPNESKINDTIRQVQEFGHAFAYDDGSAEKAYYLDAFSTAPAILALEYALYLPDTLRGVAIYFPRTVPLADYKEFSLIVYKDIAVNGGMDDIIYQQDYYTPVYQDSVNKFFVYRFDEPVAMDAGVYYLGFLQSAGGFSDSLYIGLDVNRHNGNHRYFNVNGYWEASQISGAVMIRPIVGPPLPPAGIDVPKLTETKQWFVYPNPATDKLYFQTLGAQSDLYAYQIVDLMGRTALQGNIKNHQTINLKPLSSGVYFFQLKDKSGLLSSQKIICK